MLGYIDKEWKECWYIYKPQFHIFFRVSKKIGSAPSLPMELTRGRYSDDVQNADNDKDDDGDNHSEDDYDDDTFFEDAIHIA